MPTIDSDAHVLETMDTWKFLREEEQRFVPAVMQKQSGTDVFNNEGRAQKEYWVVNNRIYNKDRNVGSNTPEDSREMRDVEARIRHMDELEVDVQVLYPTLFLRPVADNGPLDYALCRSYNRWLAEIWKKGRGRLRWIAAVPTRAMDKVREELEFAKDHGACGFLMRSVECELPPNDPYFHPLYEIAGDLDLAVCFHLGTGSFLVHDLYMKDTAFTRFKLPTVGAFHSLLLARTPAQFPKVRWGFVEASANWLPFVIIDLRHRFRRQGKRLPDNLLAANNIYVTCEITDDLSYVLKVSGEENLVIGTDYGHTDSSAEIEALRLLRDTKGVSAAAIDKILWDNPRRLYGL